MNNCQYCKQIGFNLALHIVIVLECNSEDICQLQPQCGRISKCPVHKFLLMPSWHLGLTSNTLKIWQSISNYCIFSCVDAAAECFTCTTIPAIPVINNCISVPNWGCVSIYICINKGSNFEWTLKKLLWQTIIKPFSEKLKRKSGNVCLSKVRFCCWMSR